jgi:hypothetical protein
MGLAWTRRWVSASRAGLSVLFRMHSASVLNLLSLPAAYVLADVATTPLLHGLTLRLSRHTPPAATVAVVPPPLGAGSTASSGTAQPAL